MTESPAGTALTRELKFAFPRQLTPSITGWLRGRCLPDGDHPANSVTSIYFDSIRLDAFEEKLNSDYRKTKVRLRWYGDYVTSAPSGPVFLEVKRKEGVRREKIRRLFLEDAAEVDKIALHDSRLHAVNSMVRTLGAPGVGPLFPIARICYRRLRLLDPVRRLRISIDTDIRGSEFNNTLLHGAGPVELADGVVEIKGAIAELPAILSQLTALGCRQESFSKFGICLLTASRAI